MSQPNMGFLPGQAQQQQNPQSHPTVPYGLPGGPPAVIMPSNNAPQQQQFQQLPQGLPQAPMSQGQAPQQFQQNLPPYVPPQNATFPQGQNGSFQQNQPQQQQAPQPFQPQFQPNQQQQTPFQGQQQQLGRMNANAILQGEGVPPELQGRTVGQALQIYSALSQEWLQRNGAPNGGQQAQQQRQAPQQQAPNGQRPAYVQGVPNGGQRPDQTSDETRQFWQNPAEYIRNAVSEVAAPLLQQTQGQAIAQARQIASQGIPDFQQLEGDIMQSLAGAPPQDLQNPQIWISAADLARGRRARGGQQPQQFQGQRQFQGGPQVSQPANMAPIPQQVPQYGFFTEGPTPPGMQQASQSLSPEQQFYARRMGMTDQQFMDWSNTATRRG